MNPKFKAMVNSLEPTFQTLVKMAPMTADTLSAKMPKRGVYLFSQGAEYLYVGRTNNLRERIRTHCSGSSGENKAAFAFRIARHETGRSKASYRPEGSRKELMRDPVFATAFRNAKSRLGCMEVRYVEETDPTRQALLEIYAATVLNARYNDFENH